MRFLYQIGSYFADGDRGTWTWHSDYQSRWNAAIPKLTQLLKDRKILGFMLPDECVDKGLSIDHWETMIKTVRATFPRGSSIIYASDNVCGDDTNDPAKCIKHLPDELDWISSALYRDDQSTSSKELIAKYKEKYNQQIYPKLKSHQRVGINPGVGRLDKSICSDKCQAEIELNDAKEFVAWVKSDQRVGVVMPYWWGRVGEHGMKDSP